MLFRTGIKQIFERKIAFPKYASQYEQKMKSKFIGLLENKTKYLTILDFEIGRYYNINTVSST